MGQLNQGQRLRNNQNIWIRVLAESRQRFSLHIKQIEGISATGFGEQLMTIAQPELPGLMNTAPSHRRNIGDLGSCQRSIRRDEIVPETAIHPQTAVVVASMALITTRS